MKTKWPLIGEMATEYWWKGCYLWYNRNGSGGSQIPSFSLYIARLRQRL